MARQSKKVVRTPRGTTASPKAKRAYMKQADVPRASLTDALRLPIALFENLAGGPSRPLQLARVLNIDPLGSQFRILTGAAMAFGLIDGGAQAATISATPLSRRICRPTTEGADLVAKREAVLKPQMFRDFLSKYDGNQLPREDIAINVIEEMGVPHVKAPNVFGRIIESARSVGFFTEINGKTYVALDATDSTGDVEGEAKGEHDTDETAIDQVGTPDATVVSQEPSSLINTALGAAVVDDLRRRKVFVTHGKNRALVEPVKQLLEFGEMEPVVSIDRQSVSKPVPEKVMDDMRGAGAAIIHVDAEKTITDAQGTEHVILNPNVLIEIGAAMAFYGRRFILLVRDGVRLPSNLQGLYEVRYTGETLDAPATLKLLNAIKDIKNYDLPSSN